MGNLIQAGVFALWKRTKLRGALTMCEDDVRSACKGLDFTDVKAMLRAFVVILSKSVFIPLDVLETIGATDTGESFEQVLKFARVYNPEVDAICHIRVRAAVGLSILAPIRSHAGSRPFAEQAELGKGLDPLISIVTFPQYVIWFAGVCATWDKAAAK